MSAFAAFWPYAAVLAVFAAFWALLYWLRADTLARGQTEEECRTQQQVQDDVEKANAARDRLRHDAGYAASLRGRFTRKT